MSPELVDWIWRAVIGLILALVLYLIKDRRRTKLENDLAEETLQPKSKKAGIEALDSQILAMTKAWEEERTSKDRQIAALKEELADTKGKLAEAVGTVGEMKIQAERMQNELEDFKRQLEAFGNQMKEENREPAE